MVMYGVKNRLYFWNYANERFKKMFKNERKLLMVTEFSLGVDLNHIQEIMFG